MCKRFSRRQRGTVGATTGTCGVVLCAASFAQRSDRAVLNIAIAYTSRDELLRAMNTMNKGVDEGAITPECASA